MRIFRQKGKHKATQTFRYRGPTGRGIFLSFSLPLSSRYIMYVPGIHGLALKNTQMARRNGKSEESKKLKRAKDYLDSAHKQHCRTIVERYLHDEQHQKRMHEPGYTQTDMEHLTDWHWKGRITLLLLKKGVATKIETRSCNAVKEDAATPRRPKKTLNTRNLRSGKWRT